MIRLERVAKEYTGKDKTKIRVLNGISLTVEKGEMIALLGANGSGKSTLLKCLCGVICPSEGKITVDGLDTFKKRKQLVKNMGVIFNQKPSFIADLSVSDNLRFFQAIYGISQADFENNMIFLDSYLHFTGLLEKPYRKLSFGERVKCEIVSILLHEPQYIYMDEPTIGLDYVAKKGLYDLIAELKRQGRTIIIITHEVDYIEGVCDRAVILRDGQVCYEGNPRKVTDKVDKSQKLLVKYESVLCEEKAAAMKKRASAAKEEEKELEFIIPEGTDSGPLIAELAGIYRIQSLNMEHVSVREVLEDVLKEAL
jgi:ABC-2 type transport system ATP-binding protein